MTVDFRAVHTGRWLAVVMLVAVAAFGLAGLGQADLVGVPERPDGLGGWLALAAFDLAWILAATLVIMRTSVTPAWRPALRRAIVVNLLLVAGVALVYLLLDGSSLPVAPSQMRDAVRVDQTWYTEFDGGWLRGPLLVLLVGVMLAGLGLVAASVWVTRDRWGRDRGRLVRERPFGRGGHRSAEADDVITALERARRAIDAEGDVRRAVIAAYIAIERAVGASGHDRPRNLTATEFLTDAMHAGLLRDRDAVAVLLQLFDLARFSHTPMPVDAADEARRSIASLQEDLARASAMR